MNSILITLGASSLRLLLSIIFGRDTDLEDIITDEVLANLIILGQINTDYLLTQADISNAPIFNLSKDLIRLQKQKHKDYSLLLKYIPYGKDYRYIMKLDERKGRR